MAHWRIVLILALVIAAITLLAWGVASRSTGGRPSPGNAAVARKTERVVIGGHAFDLELAVDARSRERGLMERASVDEHGGMLFVFPNNLVQRQSFWMKNCLVDIDIIYLDPRGKVTATHRMKAEALKRADETDAAYEARLGQRTYPSGYPAQFAIELKAGWLDQLNLKVEDQVALDLDRLKAMAR
jgi:uncharacterized protein